MRLAGKRFVMRESEEETRRGNSLQYLRDGFRNYERLIVIERRNDKFAALCLIFNADRPERRARQESRSGRKRDAPAMDKREQLFAVRIARTARKPLCAGEHRKLARRRWRLAVRSWPACKACSVSVRSLSACREKTLVRQPSR